MADYYGSVLIAGIVVGMFFTVGMLAFVQIVEQFKFKRYYLTQTDKRKEEVNSSLNVIEKELESIVRATNTIYFKRRANWFSNFLNYLRKYWLN